MCSYARHVSLNGNFPYPGWREHHRLQFRSHSSRDYHRRESSVEEALIEMYLAGISVRRVEAFTESAVGHAGEPQHGVQPQQDLR